MRVQSITRLAALGALVAGLACAKSLDTMANPAETAATSDTTQNTSGYQAGARDTTMLSDSAKANQTKSGVIDSSGASVTGDTVTQTRPDQGQPVTAKGDTLNPSVDSMGAPVDSTSATMDTTMAAPGDSAR